MPRSIRACSSSPPHSNAMAHSSPNGRTRTIQPLAETPRRAAILKKLRSRPTVTGSAIALAILIVVILAAPFFAPQNPYDLANLNLLDGRLPPGAASMDRSEEHTSELQSLMRISYAVFCLQKKTQHNIITK